MCKCKLPTRSTQYMAVTYLDDQRIRTSAHVIARSHAFHAHQYATQAVAVCTRALGQPLASCARREPAAWDKIPSVCEAAHDHTPCFPMRVLCWGARARTAHKLSTAAMSGAPRAGEGGWSHRSARNTPRKARRKAHGTNMQTRKKALTGRLTCRGHSRLGANAAPLPVEERDRYGDRKH